MVALVGAMFTSLGSVSAAVACSANPDITLGIGEDCDVKIEDAAASDSSDDDVATVTGATDDNNTAIPDTFRITAVGVGIATVAIGDLGDDSEIGGDDDNADGEVTTFDVRVAGFGISKVAIKGDNDNVVSAGPQITVVATVRSAGSNSAAVQLTVPTTGLSIQGNGTGSVATGTTQSQTKNVTGPGTEEVEFMVNTAGAPAGEYTLTFVADNDRMFDTKDGSSEATKQDSEPLTIRIGDPGTGLASATLSLGNKMDDLPYTADDETEPETGTAGAATEGREGEIELIVAVFDSNGGKANSVAIDQITIIAPNGHIRTTHTNPAATADQALVAMSDNSVSLSEGDNGGDVGQSTKVYVSKANDKPGMVTVYALVIGPGGAARTEDLVLSFSGGTESLEVADATESLLSANPTDADADTVRLYVTTSDPSGIATTPPASGVSVTITDPDGDRVDRGRISPSREPAIMSSGGKHFVTITGHGTPESPLAAGTYTVKVKSGSLEDTAEFVVAGGAATISLEVDNDAVTVDDDLVSVTATVTDKDGHAVSKGTMVTFNASGNKLVLEAVGDGKAETGDDGTVSQRFFVIGDGTSRVLVTSGTGAAAVRIDVTDPNAEAEEAMPEEEASLSCLSSLSGFSTWTCDVEASASEIFDWISSRGATALHLNSNRMWVRYSVVDGAMVPGSSDFMVTKSDILYISN